MLVREQSGSGTMASVEDLGEYALLTLETCLQHVLSSDRITTSRRSCPNSTLGVCTLNTPLAGDESACMRGRLSGAGHAQKVSGKVYF